MSSIDAKCVSRVALTIAIVVLCNNTSDDQNKTGQAQAQLVGFEEDQQFGLIGSRQVSFGPASQIVGKSPSGRFRRQVSIPEGSPLSSQQPIGQQQPGGSNVFSFLSNLGPQVEQVKSISTLFSSSSQQQQQQPQPQPQTQQQSNTLSNVASAMSTAALMNQLSEIIRSTQDRQAKAVESVQQSAHQASQQTANAAQSAQGGIQAALADIGTGLQRIAANNPNLLPDVKNLYQSVSSKLSSASTSVAQAASPTPSGQSQFAQGVAKQIAQPQPVPSASS